MNTAASKSTEIQVSNPSETHLDYLNNPDLFSHMMAVAEVFAKSEQVPQHYRGKPNDCFITLEMAHRCKANPMMFFQNTYVVYGKPGMMATLAIALINTSGLFDGGIQYETEGSDDPFDKSYRVRCYAYRKRDGERVSGPWIDWPTVQNEGWDQNKGSKWKTMPGLMFQYRAATWFGRTVCPEVLMGMRTLDELEDVGTQIEDAEYQVIDQSSDDLPAGKVRMSPKREQDDPPYWPVNATEVRRGTPGAPLQTPQAKAPEAEQADDGEPENVTLDDYKELVRSRVRSVTPEVESISPSSLIKVGSHYLGDRDTWDSRSSEELSLAMEKLGNAPDSLLWDIITGK